MKEREPIRGTYRDYDIISAPPPSSGGVALLEILNILEGYDLAKFGNRSAQAIHLAAEAFRRAFFDRAEFLGDPDFAKIPVAQLIDKRYAAGWRETIDPAHASPSNDCDVRPAFQRTGTLCAGPSAIRCAVREPRTRLTTPWSIPLATR